MSERKELPEKERFPWEDERTSRRAGGGEMEPTWGRYWEEGTYMGWGSWAAGDSVGRKGTSGGGEETRSGRGVKGPHALQFSHLLYQKGWVLSSSLTLNAMGLGAPSKSPLGCCCPSLRSQVRHCFQPPIRPPLPLWPRSWMVSFPLRCDP